MNKDESVQTTRREPLFKGREKNLEQALEQAQTELGRIHQSCDRTRTYLFARAGWAELVWEETPEGNEVSAPGLPTITLPRSFEILRIANPYRLNAEKILEIAQDQPDTVFKLRPSVDNPEGYIKKLGIAKDSGIVGRLMPGNGGVSIYYEGNLYKASNLGKLHEREHCAAGRLIHQYPTVARTSVPNLEELLELFEVTIWYKET